MVHLSSLLLKSLKSQLNVNSALHLHVTKFVALHLMYMDSNFDLKPSSRRVHDSQTILCTGCLRRL